MQQLREMKTERTPASFPPIHQLGGPLTSMGRDTGTLLTPTRSQSHIAQSTVEGHCPDKQAYKYPQVRIKKPSPVSSFSKEAKHL